VGEYTEWYDNGREHTRGVYKNGKDGLWTTWDKTGKVISQQRYEAGKRVQE
jgi:antitoxin component YwqK of YwqJK toxin-antitoxin module